MGYNRVYYGEYTLKHWIDLLVYKNIVLPDYQRSFVWDKSRVIRLFDSLEKDYYVPPVIIGCYNNGKEKKNIIIDGQQRLSSLLLGALAIYPKKSSYKRKKGNNFANENDDILDDSVEELEWTYQKLITNGNESVDLIKQRISQDKSYEKLEINGISEDFFLKHYLGFSYLIPDADSVDEYFPNLFKNINTSGTSLSPLESRRSIYFLKPGLEGFFDPKFCKSILVVGKGHKERIDFVRYLSIVFNYKKVGDTQKVARGYGRRMEDYYTEFIMSVVNKSSESVLFSFQEEYVERISKLEDILNNLNWSNITFQSIIDADVYLIGLIYYVVLEGNTYINNKDNLITCLDKEISNLKSDSENGEKHKKSPSYLKYLVMRISSSIDIYREAFDNGEA